MNGVALSLTLTALMMGHNNFGTRQHAERVLERSWSLSFPAVLWASEHSDPEIKFRANRVLSGHLIPVPSVMKDSAFMYGQVFGFPLCDSVPGFASRQKYMTVSCSALQEANVPLGRPWYFEYRYATRLWIESEGWPHPLTVGVMVLRTKYHDIWGRYP